jgi:hypothetical protein
MQAYPRREEQGGLDRLGFALVGSGDGSLPFELVPPETLAKTVDGDKAEFLRESVETRQYFVSLSTHLRPLFTSSPPKVSTLSFRPRSSLARDIVS